MNISLLRTTLFRCSIVATLIGMFSPQLPAQTTAGAAVPFLLIAPNARYGGMGETGTSNGNDVSASFWNIGALGFQKNSQVALNYSKWLPQFNADLHYSFVNGCTYIESLNGMLSGHFTFLDLGQFQRTFEDGSVGEVFRSLEFAIGVGYSTKLSDNLGVGIQARYIHSALSNVSVSGSDKGSGTGRSVSFDLGVEWKPKLGLSDFPEDFLSLGASINNIGPKIFYIEITQADPLPTTFRLGATTHLIKDEYNDLSVSADFTKLLVRRDSNKVDPVPISLVSAWGNGKGVEFSAGAEYWYEQLVALRIGYFTESAEAGNRRFLTFGAGVRYDIYGLDFSYINTIEQNHPLANTLRFSLLIDFDRATK